MLVQATDKYEKLNLKDNELGRIPKEGEQFEVSKERYKVLTQTNKFNTVFVEKVATKDEEGITLHVNMPAENEEIKTNGKKIKVETLVKEARTKKTTAKKITNTRKKK